MYFHITISKIKLKTSQTFCSSSSSSSNNLPPSARLLPNSLPVTSSLRSEQVSSLRSEQAASLRSEQGTTQSEGLSSLRSEPPKLAHRLSLEQQQMTARCEARHSLEQQQQQQQYKQELVADNNGAQHQQHQPQHALLGEGRLSQSGGDHHHSEARLSLEHAQSLAEQALRLEQERRLGHDRKQQDQRQEQLRREDQRQEQLRREAAVDSKAALHRRFSEADHTRLSRLQGDLT